MSLVSSYTDRSFQCSGHDDNNDQFMNKKNVDISIQFIEEKQDNSLKMHSQKYFESLESSKKKMDDIDEINRIRKFFAKNKVKIVKFNHSFDSSVQRFTQFDGYITIDPVSKFIDFTNKKPNSNPTYILEADPQEVERQQIKYKQKMARKFK